MNNLIAYIATDRNGKSYLYSNPPVRTLEGYISDGILESLTPDMVDFKLPTWNDEPIKVSYSLKLIQNEKEEKISEVEDDQVN